jgi:hypothetical protein
LAIIELRPATQVRGKRLARPLNFLSRIFARQWRPWTCVLGTQSFAFDLQTDARLQQALAFSTQARALGLQAVVFNLATNACWSSVIELWRAAHVR